MEKRIIARGLLAGAIGSVAAFVFARTFVEPLIDRAIAYEEASTAGRPRARDRTVQPWRAGQHRDGLRSAGVRRRDGRLVRGGVLRGVRPRRESVAPAAVGPVGRRNVPVALRDPVPEVPAEPAGRQPRRNDPAAHPVVSADGGALGCAARGCGGAGPQPCGAVRRVERDAHRRRFVCGGHRDRHAGTADDRRDCPDDFFPADVLYEFRLYSLGTQFVLWAIIAVVFALDGATTRSSEAKRSRRARQQRDRRE